MNPDYIGLLFSETAGNYLIAVALVLQIIGFYVNKKDNRNKDIAGEGEAACLSI